jgi:hypothetical protein
LPALVARIPMMETLMASDKDLHAEALEAYEEALDAAEEDRKRYIEDYRFARLGEQWPEEVQRLRNQPGKERPMLTLNGLPAFGRQVINDIRQNRPSIKVRPFDSGADIETALVLSGLIKNIENNSRAWVAYETAVECAVYGGFGYWRIDIDYACDDSFDQDIRIKRIVNPLSVLGDPYSTEAGSLDWNYAFVCEILSKKEFEETYPDAEPVDFQGMDTQGRQNWTVGEDVLVAEYWKREKAAKTILKLSNGQIIDEEEYFDPMKAQAFALQGIQAVAAREVETFKVKQCILNGQQILTKRKKPGGESESQYDWPGKHIPIIQVIGDELNLEGKRILQSMIHDVKDAQRQINYWETTATELVALAPRVPFIGEEGFASIDKNWETVNTQSHPYLEYKRGSQPPQRQQLDSGPAAGAIQEALRANDNVKKILGMYDASLGARSNETSGKAIMARQREGDVSTFHFADNLNRAIQDCATVVLDLIPHVYTADRVVRVLGDDGVSQDVKLGTGPRQPQQAPMPGQNTKPPRIGALQGVFDLGMGKYDVVVEAGPSNTTQRQETVEILTELMRAQPDLVMVAGDILVKNIDGLKEGEELARRLKLMLPPNLQEDGEQQIPPQVQQMIQQGQELIAQLQEELGKEKSENLKGAAEIEKSKVEMARVELDKQRLPIEESQAQAQLAIAQKELVLAQAQAGAAIQSTEINTEAVASFTQAARELSEAAQRMMGVNRRKRGRAVKNPDGSWETEVIEVVE